MDKNELNRQEENKKFVEREVIYCQSSLVDSMLNKGIFDLEDIENFYYDTEEEAKAQGYNSLRDMEEKSDQAKEIFEWWLVSDYMIELLRELKEPILENDFGVWWGRTCTGQSITLDHTIDECRKIQERRYQEAIKTPLKVKVS